jgi:hypothetical protein
MFRLVNGKYEIERDGCGEVNYTGQRSFHQARNVSSAESWVHQRPQGRGWLNYCPRCAEEADPAAELAGLYIFRKSSDD